MISIPLFEVNMGRNPLLSEQGLLLAFHNISIPLIEGVRGRNPLNQDNLIKY